MRVIAKLAGMRKEQEFVVYPYKLGQTSIVVQSDKAIGQFDISTGKGVLNYKGSSGKYFPHLNKFLGAEDYQFPADFVLKCMEIQPKSGDKIGAGVYVA